MICLFQLSVAALALASTLFFLAPEAHAHASFVRSDPADGSVSVEKPKRFQLVFSEPVSPIVLTLVGSEADPVRLDRFHVYGATVIVEPPELADGSYALSWRVTSADGHPIGGSVLFSIGEPSADAPRLQSTGSEGLRPFIWTTRLALYLGLFLGIGALPFHVFIAPAPPLARRISLTLIGTGLVAVVPSLGLQGLDLMGASVGGIGRIEVWATALASSYAYTVLIAAAALVLGLAAWFAPPGWPVRVLSVLALVGIGAALAASGHASAASPQWLTGPAVFFHGVAIAVWAGSLVAFALVLQGGGDAARRMLARFSTAILPAVGALIVAGIVLSVVQIGRLEALWKTDYGQVLLIKLGLLLLLFTLAAINRFALTPAFVRRERQAKRQFARSVRIEVALICMILAVASLWRFTPPPRSIMAFETMPPASLHIHTDEAMAELTVTPGRTGQVTVTIHVMRGDFGPLEPKEVTLSLANPTAGIEPVRRPMKKEEEGGSWRTSTLTLPVSGLWQAKIDLLISDFEMATLEGEIAIAP